MHRCPRSVISEPAGWLAPGVGRGWTGLEEESIKAGTLRPVEAVLPAPLPLDAVELASAHCVPRGFASCGDAPCVNEEDPRVGLSVGEERNELRQLPTVDPSARASMKNAANCDT